MSETIVYDEHTAKLEQKLKSYFESLSQMHIFIGYSAKQLEGEVKNTIEYETREFDNFMHKITQYIEQVFEDYKLDTVISASDLNHITARLNIGLVELLYGQD